MDIVRHIEFIEGAITTVAIETMLRRKEMLGEAQKRLLGNPLIAEGLQLLSEMNPKIIKENVSMATGDWLRMYNEYINQESH